MSCPAGIMSESCPLTSLRKQTTKQTRPFIKHVLGLFRISFEISIWLIYNILPWQTIQKAYDWWFK